MNIIPFKSGKKATPFEKEQINAALRDLPLDVVTAAQQAHSNQMVHTLLVAALFVCQERKLDAEVFAMQRKLIDERVDLCAFNLPECPR